MSKIKGVKSVRAALRKSSPALRREMGGVIAGTVEGVATSARANIEAMVGTSEKPYVMVKGVKMRRRLLRRLYKTWTSKGALKGRVGYITPAARRAAYYARFVHDGTAHSASRPFHQNAVDQHKPGFNRGASEALRRALDAGLKK